MRENLSTVRTRLLNRHEHEIVSQAGILFRACDGVPLWVAYALEATKSARGNDITPGRTEQRVALLEALAASEELRAGMQAAMNLVGWPGVLDYCRNLADEVQKSKVTKGHSPCT